MLADVPLLVWGALALVLLAWMFFAIAETVLLEARATGVATGGSDQVDPLVYEIQRHPRRVVIAIVLGREIILVTAAVLAAVVGYIRGGVAGGGVALLAVAITLILLRGAVAGLAVRAGGRVAVGGGVLQRLLAPLASVAAVSRRVGRRLVHVIHGEAPGEDNIFARDELGAISEDSEDEYADAERALVARAVAFGERLVRHVLTPRRDMVAVSVDVAPEDLLQVVRTSGCSRIPVFRENPDDVIGILYVKDLIGHTLGPGGIAPLLRQPYVVPADRRVADLFQEFRARKVHIALVLDEYGSLVGLVAMEDLLEELFGEIRDEFDDEEEPTIHRRGPHSFIVSGRIAVGTLNGRLKLHLPETGDGATLAGVVIEQLGHVPTTGESVQLDGVTVTVEKLDGPAIELCRVDL